MNMNPALSPRQAYSVMSYDSPSDRMILFGADGHETWAYDFDGNRWTNLTPSNPPSLEEGGLAMAYDSESHRAILLGYARGVDAQGMARFYPETWAYDFETNTWINMRPAAGPLETGRLAYDSQSDRVILFGGRDPLGAGNETWAYDFDTNTWTNMFPTARPTFSSYAHLAYDVNSDRTVLFGGDSFEAQETWAYDSRNNTWSNMRPSTWPSGVDSPLVYDSESDRLIRFGGSVKRGELIKASDETWAYNLESNTWTKMNPASKPPRSHGSHAMAYDSQSDRVIWYSLFSDGPQTWAFDYRAAAAERGPEPAGIPLLVWPIVGIVSVAAAAVVMWWFMRGRRTSARPPPSPPRSLRAPVTVHHGLEL